ncbi:MAG: hypothetical protein ACFUZC_16560 [Chthoniobacteraceae bacterium]
MSLRNTIDANLIRSIALPAAGASAYSASIDVGTGPHVEKIEFRVEIPATASLASGKNVTAKLQSSSDDSTYTDIAELASLVVTGASSGGGAAALREYQLPTSALRYVRLSVAVDASGGDNTAISAVLTPLL